MQSEIKVDFENNKVDEEFNSYNPKFSDIDSNKINPKLFSDVSIIVNNIVSAVDSMYPIEDDIFDEQIMNDQFKSDDTTTITNGILSEPLVQLVSQININAESYEDIDLDNNITKANTFEMTEVTNSKTVIIDFSKNISDQTVDKDKILQNDSDVPLENFLSSLPKYESIINDCDDLETQFTDEQLKKAYNEFKMNNKLPSYLMRDPLLEYARFISLQYIVDEDYDKAMENDNYVDQLMHLYNQNDFSDNNNYPSIHNLNNIKNNLESRLEMAKKHQKDNSNKLNEKILKLKKNQEKKLTDLEKLHEEECQKFIESCSSPSFLHRFSKPSSHLLQMRHLQKSLAIQHNFNEAKKIKSEADKLQKKETKEARLRAAECVKKLYQIIIQRQRNQKQCIVENTFRKITSLEEYYNRENSAYNNLINQLELRINEMATKINSNSNSTNSLTSSVNKISSSNSSSFYSKSGFNSMIVPSHSSIIPILKPNTLHSSMLSNNFKRKREMISQVQKVTKLDVKLTGVQKIFVNMKKKPVAVHPTVF